MADNFEMIVTTLFGIESVAVAEIKRLGYEVTNVADGRITFKGDFEALCRVNMWLRTGERVLIKVGSFKAVTFEELFQGCKSLDWAKWLPKDCMFPVKGFSMKSQLFSVSDCQAIIKKSIVDSLSLVYGISHFEETGAKYQIEFSIQHDIVTLMLDTSGDGLNKRGYRQNQVIAPLKETIAAAIVILSRFSYSGVFADPFCGSGTLPIEAGMIAKNIAPGLNRSFASEAFSQIPTKIWEDARTEAQDLIRHNSKITILASDIDHVAVKRTSENAKLAGVSELISTKCCPVSEFFSSASNGTIVCNPPYGERLLDISEAENITKDIRKVYDSLDNWSLYVLSALQSFESCFGKEANKRRKLYNGMIKCNLYQYNK